MKLESINPYNLEKVKSYEVMTSSEVEERLQLATQAQAQWKNFSLDQRSQFFLRLAELLKEQVDSHAFLMTQEMGKLLSESEAEVLKCAQVCEYYAHKAQDFLKPQVVSEKQEIHYRPLGVILAIMPWNFPYWQVLRFAAPTLMAGNTAVLKHASNVMGCSMALEQLFIEAGFPKGVFQSLRLPASQMESVIAHPQVQAISLTGSTTAGKIVAQQAGAHLKKCVLELGGSDPYILFEDADLDLALEACAKSRLINAGQSCIAAKRFIIHKSLYEEFKQRLTDKFQNLNQGDPLLKTTDLAPLASMELRDQLHKQVLSAIQHGAICTLGGDYPLACGAFYNPTILENISPENPAYSEEFFGPVASLYSFQTLEEAVDIANATPFGLGAAIFSKNPDQAFELAQSHIQSGSVFINSYVRSSPEMPFGGIKQSGYGRELSHTGILEFVNIKSLSKS